MKRNIIISIFLILILATLYALYKYISFTNHYVSSDAVFVKSDTLTNLSFKFPGKIDKIYVNEGDKIKKGEILAKLDTTDLKIEKKELIQNINALNNKIKATIIQKKKLINDINDSINITKVKIDKLKNLIKAKKYTIKAKEIKLQKMKKDYLRFKRLFDQNKISREKYENVKTSFLAFQNEIKADKKVLNSMYDDLKELNLTLQINQNNKKDIQKLTKLIKSMIFQNNALKEKLALINQNIKESYIYAPFNGIVAKKFANADEIVPAGKMILSVVNLKNVYVLDLLEEKKLKGIKKGCKVKIHIDALDKDFNGYVSKILPASAATYAILPRDISSGEFTKLQQRFYVRIRFDKVPRGIKVGMSGEVTINKCKKGD